MKRSIGIFLPDCPRCRGTHKGIYALLFTHPCIVNGIEFHYYTLCPNNNEPVILHRGDVELPEAQKTINP